MRGKKRVSNAAVEASVKQSQVTSDLLTGPTYVEGVKHLSHKDLLTLQLAEMKVIEAQKDLKIAQMELEQIRYEFEGRARQNQLVQAQLLGTVRGHQARLKELHTELERVYEIDLQKITYDDATGEIKYPPEGVPSE